MSHRLSLALRLLIVPFFVADLLLAAANVGRTTGPTELPLAGTALAAAGLLVCGFILLRGATHRQALIALLFALPGLALTLLVALSLVPRIS